MPDPDPERPCVADQENDPDSLLNFTRKLIELRHTHPALGAEGKLRRLVSEYADSPLVYERELDGERFLIAVNPAAKAYRLEIALAGAPERIAGVGEIKIGQMTGLTSLDLAPVSAGIFQIR